MTAQPPKGLIMKKILIILVCLIFALTLNIQDNTIPQNTPEHLFVLDNVEDGCFGFICFQNHKTKIRVQKDGITYIYDYVNFGELTNYPLQLSSGEYEISLLRHIVFNRYRVAQRLVVEFKGCDLKVYLNETQYFETNEKLERIFDEIFAGAEADMEKFNRAYDYILNNIVYDHEKAKNVKPPYVPNPYKTITNKSGICFDYASLLATMLRYVDVPTRLVKGYSNHVNSYHAWNEVYIDGEWHIVDSTVDAVYFKNNIRFDTFKPMEDYRKASQY